MIGINFDDIVLPERVITIDDVLRLLEPGRTVKTMRKDGIKWISKEFERLHLVRRMVLRPQTVQLSMIVARKAGYGVCYEDDQGFIFIKTDISKLNAFDPLPSEVKYNTLLQEQGVAKSLEDIDYRYVYYAKYQADGSVAQVIGFATKDGQVVVFVNAEPSSIQPIESFTGFVKGRLIDAVEMEMRNNVQLAWVN